MTDIHGPALAPQIAEVILDASRLIGRTLNPGASIEGILALLSTKLGLTRGRVVLPDPATGLLRIAYSHGLSDSEIERGLYALGEGVTGRVMSSGEIALIPDISKEPTYVARVFAPVQRHEMVVAYIAVPIMRDDVPLGVLALHRVESLQGHFDNDLFIAQIMAAMIGQILHIHNLVTQQTRRLQQENRALKDRQQETTPVHGIIGKSVTLRHSIEQARKAAASEATVMLAGESGCGKERFARMIHLAGARRDKPFVCINSAAIPVTLLESELFGHEKGAFTGAASSRAGKFELAAGGTLFLDEVAEMPLDLQAKLLRVLQEKRVQRLGGSREIDIDVRIITATNKRLEECVNSGSFRLDLFYRLNVVRIQLPPLRQRRDDIELLALYFLNRCNQLHRRNVVLNNNALARLKEYDWPGNVRQLENVIERLVVMSDRDVVGDEIISATLTDESGIAIEEDVSFTPRSTAELPQVADFAIRPYAKVRPDERDAIIQALRQARGNKTVAARVLGMTSRQLHYRLNKLCINA
jgi:Nif-specific regulatory protein